MLALNADPPALTPPFATRRCGWALPDLQSHALLVLARSEMFLAPLSSEKPNSTRIADAEDDADLAELLGPDVPAVPLDSIRGARLDLLQNALAIELDRGRLDLKFNSARAADACFTQLWRRLVPRLRLNTLQGSRWSRARLPLTVLGAILAIVAALALAISVVDGLPTTGEGASIRIPGGSLNVPASVHALIGWMDWRVVCALGGAAAAAAQVWLYRRVTQPPLTVELVRECN